MSQKYKTFDDIVCNLPAIHKVCVSLSETLLANLAMISEIPAPSGREEARIDFIKRRFSECGLTNTSSDELGNAAGVFAGQNTARNILLLAHADTVFSERRDHTVLVHADRMSSPGIADNSLGLAVLATLPTLLEKLDLQFDANLVLAGITKSLGRADLQGARFFLANNTIPFTAGICIEGVQIGRLSYTSAGMLRGEVSCRVPEENDWIRRGTAGAILVINEVINRILGIPLPRKPQTSIVLGSIESGVGFNIIPTEATLRFEVRSESSEIVEQVSVELTDIMAEVASQTGSDVELDVLARREVAGLKIAHPLVKHTREIMKSLDLTPRITPSISELSVLIASDIPAITLGITEGDHLHEKRESVKIEPMFTGLTQLIGILLAIDGGFCDAIE